MATFHATRVAVLRAARDGAPVTSVLDWTATFLAVARWEPPYGEAVELVEAANGMEVAEEVKAAEEMARVAEQRNRPGEGQTRSFVSPERTRPIGEPDDRGEPVDQ